MNNLEDILEFYKILNTFKTSDFGNDNLSYADNIYGSMILAVAMDSEFKETNDLGKILRLLILDGFYKMGLHNNLTTLNIGKYFETDFKDLYEFKSIDAYLTFKYRMIDTWLKKIINRDDDINTFLRDGRLVLGSFNTCSDNTKYDEVLKFYYYNYRLMSKVRTGWDNNHWNIKTDRRESVSEHVVSTVGLALAMGVSFKYNIDLDKVLKILAIHEIGEILIGDITPFDGITPSQKQEMEHKAMYDILGNLTDKDKLYEILLEFDTRKSMEAKFAYFCDKMEADLQSKIYQDNGMQHSLDDQKNNIVFSTSLVKQMIENGASTAFDIWYTWDKHIYEDDKDYPEFSLLLDTAKDYKLDNNTCLRKSRILRDK